MRVVGSSKLQKIEKVNMKQCGCLVSGFPCCRFADICYHQSALSYSFYIEFACLRSKWVTLFIVVPSNISDDTSKTIFTDCDIHTLLLTTATTMCELPKLRFCRKRITKQRFLPLSRQFRQTDRYFIMVKNYKWRKTMKTKSADENAQRPLPVCLFR